MEKKLKIVQIFYSLQGEGIYVGKPSIFIRFYGCNLSCSFCDDLKHKSQDDVQELTFDDVYEKIKQYPSKQIIITGGEPSIYDLNDFIMYLQEKEYFLTIESNGHKLKNVKKANFITYSPKDWSNILTNGYDEIKFIVDKKSDIDKILEIKTDKPIFIQPQNKLDTIDKDNLEFCIEFVKKYPQFLLSVQMHKFLGVL